MPTLEAFAAVRAPTDVDIELAMDGLPRNLGLVLLLDGRFLDRPAAVGAGFGERRFVGFVDLLRWLAMGFGAVILTRFTARFLRLFLGRAFGKRRRLAFAGAALGVEQLQQALLFGFEFRDASP